MRLITLILVVTLAGCGTTIQTYERVSQDLGRPLSAYIGGQVLKVQKTSDLPNAFGKADVFGGKINRGYTELRYQGLAPDGRLIFRVTEIETESTETTMSRYGRSTSTLNAQRVGNSVYGTVTTYDAPRGSTERLPPNTTQFALDLNSTKELNIGSIKVQILGATETSLSYQLLR
jgi:hypothetical protein